MYVHLKKLVNYLYWLTVPTTFLYKLAGFTSRVLLNVTSEQNFRSYCHVNEILGEETVRISNCKWWITWVWRRFMSSGPVSLFIARWKSCQLHISWQPKKFNPLPLLWFLCSQKTVERGDSTAGVKAHIWIDTVDKIQEGLRGLYVIIQPCFYWRKQNREKWLIEDPFSLSVEGRNEWQNDAAGLSQKWNNVIVSLVGS